MFSIIVIIIIVIIIIIIIIIIISSSSMWFTIVIIPVHTYIYIYIMISSIITGNLLFSWLLLLLNYDLYLTRPLRRTDGGSKTLGALFPESVGAPGVAD